jgi:hypothetical protein
MRIELQKQTNEHDVKKLWKIEVQENFNCEKEKKKEKRLGT